MKVEYHGPGHAPCPDCPNVGGVKVPSAKTLAKYGLTYNYWYQFLDKQNYSCAVCKTVPKSGRLCVDHEHVKGYAKLPARQRAWYVRGLACFTCNRYKVAKNKLNDAEAVLAYLQRHRDRFERLRSTVLPGVVAVKLGKVLRDN